MNPGDRLRPRTRSRTENTRLVVLNREAAVLDEHLLSKDWDGEPSLSLRIANTADDPRPEILVLADKAYVFGFRRP